MNIFNILPIYAPKWELADSRNFTKEEIEGVIQAIVVASQYGNSVQFTMKAGGCTFIPLDRNSTLGVGDLVDMSVARLVTLTKPGETNIYRVDI